MYPKENKVDENLSEEDKAMAQAEYENLKRQTQVIREHNYLMEIVHSFYRAKSFDEVEKPEEPNLMPFFNITKRAFELLRVHNVTAQFSMLFTALRQVCLWFTSAYITNNLCFKILCITSILTFLS